MHKISGVLALGLLPLMTGTVSAETVKSHHMILAPKCLVAEAGITAAPLTEKGDRVLLDADDGMVGQLVKAKHDSLNTLKSCGDFRDVTRALKISGNDAKKFLTKPFHTAEKTAVSPLSYKTQYRAEVNQLIATVNPQNMWTSLTALTHFKDRFANSKTGVLAAEWIKNQVTSLSEGRSDVSVYTVPTTGYSQPSVILKVGDSVSEPGIVISGSIDTPASGWFSNMQGAGNNGSGAVTVLEAARVILDSGMRFKKPIYFIWYAAEMNGRVGSSDVVSEFELQGKKTVNAALHFDTVGYGRDRTMWLLDDYADSRLNHWLTTLIHTYVRKPVLFERFDSSLFTHASWTGAGVSASSAIGDRVQKLAYYTGSYEHDTLDKLSLEHMTDYLKLAVAFVVEGAEPIDQ